MTKTKPSDQVASRFSISGESARFFLGRVQKSFKTEKPPHQLIVEFIEGLEFKSLPKAYEVAKGMYEAGVWVYPLNAEPAEPQEDADLYFS